MSGDDAFDDIDWDAAAVIFRAMNPDCPPQETYLRGQALAEVCIAAKGLLQAPVVEPERDRQGALTGFWLVTIGEGRRQAPRLLAKRKRIAKTHLVRCVAISPPRWTRSSAI